MNIGSNVSKKPERYGLRKKIKIFNKYSLILPENSGVKIGQVAEEIDPT